VELNYDINRASLQLKFLIECKTNMYRFNVSPWNNNPNKGIKEADKNPYALPIITSGLVKQEGGPFLETHEWYSIGYCVFFMLLGFLDMKMRKEKG